MKKNRYRALQAERYRQLLENGKKAVEPELEPLEEVIEAPIEKPKRKARNGKSNK